MDVLILDLPPSVVNNSAKGILSVSGISYMKRNGHFAHLTAPLDCITAHVLAPVINSLGSLLRMPYGCGEQNMVNFAPAVLIKRYLERTNQLTPQIDRKATLYMETGTRAHIGCRMFVIK